MTQLSTLGQTFKDLTLRINAGEATQEEMSAYKEALEKTDFWQIMGDLAAINQKAMIEKTVKEKTAQLAIVEGCNRMREGLGFSHASVLEKMLINEIVLCWLNLQYMQYQATTQPARHLDFWDKRVNAAQMRFLRANESLARIRKMAQKTPAILINIAQNQQVNQVIA